MRLIEIVGEYHSPIKTKDHGFGRVSGHFNFDNGKKPLPKRLKEFFEDRPAVITTTLSSDNFKLLTRDIGSQKNFDAKEVLSSIEELGTLIDLNKRMFGLFTTFFTARARNARKEENEGRAPILKQYIKMDDLQLAVVVDNGPKERFLVKYDGSIVDIKNKKEFSAEDFRS